MSAPRLATVPMRPVQNPLAAWREIEGVVVIISPEDSVLHELNPTASFIWKHSTGERTAREIARLLVGEFEVDFSTALADTCELLEDLRRRNLLQVAAAGVSHG